MRMQRLGFTLVVGSSLLCRVPLPVMAQQFTVRDLGLIYISPFNHRIGAFGVNNQGQVVGGAPVGGTCHAVLWQPGSSTPIDLGTLGGDSYALGINNTGVVVGRYGSPFFSGDTNGFAWDSTNGMRELLPLSANSFGTAASVNSSLEIAGDSSNFSGDPNTHAVIWIGATPVDLGTLPGMNYSSAASQQSSINPVGQVVGTSGNIGGSFEAVLWNPSSPQGTTGTMIDLGIPGGQSFASTINASGTVGGAFHDSSGALLPFIWTPLTPNGTSGSMISLGTLGGTNTNGVYGINDPGQAVGMSMVAGDSVFHAFLYSGGTMQDLNNLIPFGSGWELNAAFSINNSGQIVGYGTLNGQLHSYVLTPAASFNICPLYDSNKAVKSGAVLPIKLQLCDGNGNDLSSASVTIHATGITQISTQASSVVQDAGNANPDNDFRFDSTLGSTGGYILNLSTKGLTTGSYDLNFNVTGTSSPFAAPFQVK